MLNPLRLAGKAIGVGAGFADGAVKAVGGALGQSDAPKHSEAPEQERTPGRPPAERRPAKPSITDGALADKVESVLFSDPSVPKGKIDINAVGRDVYLRGEAKTPDMIKALERRAKAIPEVDQVENLLHLPKTPAPTRADTPKRAQKSRRTKGTAAARKRTSKKVNAEAKATVGETPKELAAKGEGRKPAPMGSTKAVNAEAKATVGETPKEVAAKGEGRKPAPMGSTEKKDGSSPRTTETKPAKPAGPKASEEKASAKAGEDVGA